MLALHNRVRAHVSPKAKHPLPKLKYDVKLEERAQSWANRCVWEHNPGRSKGFPLYVGENIYMGSYADYIGEAVKLWAAERIHYNYRTNTCAANQVCGHYTQLVWANTHFVGCAAKNCGSKNGMYGWFVVCDYMQGGNYVGEKPYQV